MKDAIDFARQDLERCLEGYPNAPRVEFSIAPELGEQEYTVDGDSGGYRIAGGSPVGAMYGAYALLARLGFRWFSPDEWDEERPEALYLPVLHLREKPSFSLRGFFGVEKRDTEQFIRWMIRNRMNFWTASTGYKELCLQCGFALRNNPPGGTHRVCSDFLPPEKYFASHPEWYALIDGQRRANQPADNVSDNICFSNDEACHELALNLAEALEHGALSAANTLVLCPFDNGVWCQCENCARLGNKTSQFMHLLYICQKVIKERVSRKVTLITSAYHEMLPIPSEPLPDDFDYDSVLVEYFPIERCYAHDFNDANCLANSALNARLQAWTQNTKFKVILCEYYNVSTFASMAFPLADGMAREIPYYKSCGIDAINYMHVSTALWGELAFNNWTFAQKLWNADADTSDFFEMRYHASAMNMRRFYDILAQAMRNCKLLKHYQTMEITEDGRLVNFCFWRRLADLAKQGPFFPNSHFSYDKDMDGLPSLLTTMRLLEDAKACLKEALANCDDEVVQPRLYMDMCRFSYTYDIIHFIEALARLRLNEDNAELARKAALDLNKYGERLRQEKSMQANIRAEGAPNLKMYMNGLTSTQCQDAYAALMKKYNLPTAPWEPGELRNVVQG